MNHQIKFRAWDEEVKAWTVPFTLADLATGEFLSPEALNAMKVVQFTGLYDKNGKEICEGDIVLGNVGYGKHKLTVKKHESYRGGLYPFCVGANPNESEVIGDIHSNPELLSK